MTSLLKNVTNSLWHAFNVLHQEQRDRLGSVNKSKLKVLTANIAILLDLYGVERGLDHYRSTSTLNFKHYHYYLMEEVFSSIPHNITLAQQRNFETKIDEVCWLICRKKYLRSTQNDSDERIPTNNNSKTKNNCVYKLFRLFCMFGDLIETDEDNEEDCCRVLLHPLEAFYVMKQLMSSLGLEHETEKEYNYLTVSQKLLDFKEFLSLIKFKSDINLNDYNESLQEAIEDLYQTYIMDVIKKGYLMRRGYLLPTFREYWFVLQPCELSYYKNPNEKELCGTIPLNSNCMITPVTGKQEKLQKFLLLAGDRNYELATSDHKSRMQWIRALQLGITYSTGKDGFQRDLTGRRKHARELENIKKNEDEKLRSCHLKQVEETRVQLELEKMARMAAETQARELEAVAKEDSRRVAELEDIKMTLEKLLEEETQAKHDEEIVRALQARVLAEEWEKREELEQLQNEQREILNEERKKRIDFEVQQMEKEQKLKIAECKLKELEEERQRLDKELQLARKKIQHSEESKEIFEAKLKTLTPSLLHGANQNDGQIRRSHSFMAPSSTTKGINTVQFPRRFFRDLQVKTDAAVSIKSKIDMQNNN